MADADVFIGLGSNLGNGPENLLAAWRKLGECPGVSCRRLSGCYCSSPVGMESAHWFSNAVGLIKTDLPPRELLNRLLAIEQDMGRQRQLGRDRIIDLDILLYAGLELAEPDLTIPHPAIADRLFVLLPLTELAPEHLHPVAGKTIRELLAALSASMHGQRIEQTSWPTETSW